MLVMLVVVIVVMVVMAIGKETGRMVFFCSFSFGFRIGVWEDQNSGIRLILSFWFLVNSERREILHYTFIWFKARLICVILERAYLLPSEG